MNEQIKDLKKKAMRVVGEGLGGDYLELDEDLFAELIVKECISVLDKEVYMALREDGEQAHVDVILLEHFGVKE